MAASDLIIMQVCQFSGVFNYGTPDDHTGFADQTIQRGIGPYIKD